ncbi:MAG: hypothetical protein LBR35_00865, partial [Rickettsiales bacterium]|nr:hypothetical protein [Rickettsiales bacterium]
MTRRYKLYVLLTIILMIAYIISDRFNIKNINISQKTSQNPYSLYLAGSYARKTFDFNSASFYFDELEKIDTSEEVVKNVYVLSLVEGDFEKAKQKIPAKDNTIYFINLSDAVKEKDYKKAKTELAKIESSKEEIIKHLLSAWLYAGENNKNAAYKELSKINKEMSGSLSDLHKLYIAIHFNDTKTIDALLQKLEKENLSIRAVELITYYYCENGKFKEAQNLVEEKIKDDSMISSLNDFIINYKKPEQKLFGDIQDGTAESFMNFSMIIFNPMSWELSLYFDQLSLYMEPNNDFAKILKAEILEAKNLDKQANEIYNQVSKESFLYASSQVKLANNYAKDGKLDKSEKLFKKIIKQYPDYVAAYTYLAEKYISQRDFKNALETL